MAVRVSIESGLLMLLTVSWRATYCSYHSLISGCFELELLERRDVWLLDPDAAFSEDLRLEADSPSCFLLRPLLDDLVLVTGGETVPRVLLNRLTLP